MFHAIIEHNRVTMIICTNHDTWYLHFNYHIGLQHCLKSEAMDLLSRISLRMAWGLELLPGDIRVFMLLLVKS